MAQKQEAVTKTDRFRQFMDSCLQEDIDSLRGFPLKESAINFGIAILMLLMAALHLLHKACQLAFSLVATVSELLVKGLAKIMPAPNNAQSANRRYRKAR